MLPSSSSCLARLSTMGIEDSNSALGHTRGGCANASAAASKIIAVANVASTEYLTIARISGTSGSCAFGACIWRAFQLPSLRTSVPPSVRRWIARRNVQACRLVMMPWLFFCIDPNSPRYVYIRVTLSHCEEGFLYSGLGQRLHRPSWRAACQFE